LLPFRPPRVSKAALPPAREVQVAVAARQRLVRVADGAAVVASAAAEGVRRQRQRLQDLLRDSPMESPI
jgi:hypothetical protein